MVVVYISSTNSPVDTWRKNMSLLCQNDVTTSVRKYDFIFTSCVRWTSTFNTKRKKHIKRTVANHRRFIMRRCPCNIISLECLYVIITSNGSWCIGIKGEMSGTVCVTFTWDMYIYIWVVYSFCLFCCLFIIVTWWYMWCIVWQVAIKKKYRHVW